MSRMTLVATLCDIACGLYVEGTIPSTNWGYYLFKGGLILAQSTISLLYMFYVLEIFKIKIKRRNYWIFFYAPYVLDLIFIILNTLRRSSNLLEGPNINRFDLTIYFIYLFSVYFVIIAVLCILRYHKSIKHSTAIILSLYVFFAFIGPLWQTVNPNLRVGNFTLTLSVLLIYLTVQNPEDVIDGMTSSLNRTAFTQTTSLAIADKRSFTVLLIGMDNYQFLKNWLSLDSLRDLLQSITNFLQLFSRQADIYRIADSQFTLALKNDDSNLMNQIQERIIQAFANPWRTNKLDIKIHVYTCCIHHPKDFSSMDSFYALAGLLANTESRQQEEQVIDITKLDLTKEKRRLSISFWVEQALIQEKFHLNFRPIYDVSTKSFPSIEASQYLESPNLEAIKSEEYMPIAEKNGNALKLSQHMLENVCKILSERSLEYLGVRNIIVELSAGQWLQYDLGGKILTLVKKYRINPQNLSLQIEAEVVNSAPNTVIDTLNVLAKEGFSIIIANYGIGFTQFSRTFSVLSSCISIGDAFIQENQNDDFVKDMIILIQGTGRKAALGRIETKEQAQKYMSMGCQSLAGDYFGKCMSLENLKNHLEGYDYGQL